MTSRSSVTLGLARSVSITGKVCASTGAQTNSGAAKVPRRAPAIRTCATLAQRRDKADDAMTYLVPRQALRHGRGAITQADQCAGVVSEARRGAAIEPAGAVLVVKDRSGQVGCRRYRGRQGRRDEGEGRRALLMQHRADLAEFFGGCGLRRLRGAIKRSRAARSFGAALPRGDASGTEMPETGSPRRRSARLGGWPLFVSEIGAGSRLQDRKSVV